MVNKIILSFIGTNFLFLAGGALLTAFAVVSRNDMNQKATESNIANNLLLSHSPITGVQHFQLVRVALMKYLTSYPRECHICLRDLFNRSTGLYASAEPPLPQASWLARCCLCDVYHDCWADLVV